MKGFAITFMGILLIALCGVGNHFFNLDAGGCGFVAIFIGGGMVFSGIGMAANQK